MQNFMALYKSHAVKRVLCEHKSQKGHFSHQRKYSSSVQMKPLKILFLKKNLHFLSLSVYEENISFFITSITVLKKIFKIFQLDLCLGVSLVSFRFVIYSKRDYFVIELFHMGFFLLLFLWLFYFFKINFVIIFRWFPQKIVLPFVWSVPSWFLIQTGQNSKGLWTRTLTWPNLRQSKAFPPRSIVPSLPPSLPPKWEALCQSLCED